MDYSQLDADINGNINTGNINTSDFLAIFTSTSTTPTDAAAAGASSSSSSATAAGGGWPGGGGGGVGVYVNSTGSSNVIRILPQAKEQQQTPFYALPNSNYTNNNSNSNNKILFAISNNSNTHQPQSISSHNATFFNPPLVTVDTTVDSDSSTGGGGGGGGVGGGQYGLSNLLESTLKGTITTLSPNNYVNDSYYFLNSNFYNNSSLMILNGNGAGGGNYTNQTLTNIATTSMNLTGNITTEVQWDGRYPSGYTLPQIVIASVIVTILMIIIVVGNMLVIIAIATEKSLKNIQNWFIASLAVADFFLGLIIMPFSLANELMGYWIFGSWWCDIHSAMDVLLCTASIMNLCLISLDRYWSITKAVDYLKSRTPARAAAMIAFVWTLSALICIPPLLGWKVKMPEGPLPKCAVSVGNFIICFLYLL